MRHSKTISFIRLTLPNQQKVKNLYILLIFLRYGHTKKQLILGYFHTQFERFLSSLLLIKVAASENIKTFKGTYSWPASWNSIFAKVYKKDFNNLPKGITLLLNTTFGPETFSVLSYGTVGQITHRLFAILERDTTGRESKDPATVLIKKLYWI